MAALPVFPLSVEQYHAMLDHGILNEDDCVELLDGVIVQKLTIYPPHRISTRATRQALERVIPKEWYADGQAPLTLTASEPEPDGAVIRGDSRNYFDRHPGPADLRIVIEVADATLARDRGIKKRIYAMAGIPCYWIVDLNSRRVEVYSEPRDGDYGRCDILEASELVSVLLDGHAVGTIRVNDLLP